MKTHSKTFIQRRNLVMLLPLLVLPFVTLLFWVLGGGKASTGQAKSSELNALNHQLPDPHFDKKEVWDKLSLYEMAARDSAKFEEARENDPYFDLVAFETKLELKKDINAQDTLIKGFRQKDKPPIDPNEERVNQSCRLGLLR